jgi:hypothetical protein
MHGQMACCPACLTYLLVGAEHNSVRVMIRRNNSLFLKP